MASDVKRTRRSIRYGYVPTPLVTPLHLTSLYDPRTKEISDAVEVDELFARTNVQELRRLVVFLQCLHEASFQLFHNGRKLVLQPMRHSVKRMRDVPSPMGGRDSVQERITHEVEQFLLNAAVVPILRARSSRAGKSYAE
jgi:hypothetical protein